MPHDFIGRTAKDFIDHPKSSAPKTRTGRKLRTKTRKAMKRHVALVAAITDGKARNGVYDPRYAKVAERMCIVMGATAADLATYFQVSGSTIERWKQEHPAFARATRIGRDEADMVVAHSLYRKANGYSHAEEKIHFDKDGDVHTYETVKHYAPDTEAAKFWLTNRQPDKWRARVEHTGPGGERLQGAQNTLMFVQHVTQEQASKAYTDLVELEDGSYGETEES